MESYIAIKSGGYFALVPDTWLSGIAIRPTDVNVVMPIYGGIWPLFCGWSWVDVQKIKDVIEKNFLKTYKIDEHCCATVR